jgi:hypothetical protein
MMSVLIIVYVVPMWCGCRSAVSNCLKTYEVSWITTVVWLKDNMIVYDERLKLNIVMCIHLGSNRNNFGRVVNGCPISYASSWITYAVRLKVNTITQSEYLKLYGVSRICFACNRSSIMKDASECLVNVVICSVAVKDLEVNVAELLNARELDFCFGCASVLNVSVLKLIL